MGSRKKVIVPVEPVKSVVDDAVIILPDLFTASQAREVALAASIEPLVLIQTIQGLSILMNTHIRPSVLSGALDVHFVWCDESYFASRWRIRKALEGNGFTVVEFWDSGVMWKVSWVIA